MVGDDVVIRDGSTGALELEEVVEDVFDTAEVVVVEVSAVTVVVVMLGVVVVVGADVVPTDSTVVADELGRVAATDIDGVLELEKATAGAAAGGIGNSVDALDPEEVGKRLSVSATCSAIISSSVLAGCKLIDFEWCFALYLLYPHFAVIVASIAASMMRVMFLYPARIPKALSAVTLKMSLIG